MFKCTNTTKSFVLLFQQSYFYVLYDICKSTKYRLFARLSLEKKSRDGWDSLQTKDTSLDYEFSVKGPKYSMKILLLSMSDKSSQNQPFDNSLSNYGTLIGQNLICS